MNWRVQNGKAILDNFREMYRHKHEDSYRINYAMIAMAEKISEYYTLGEIHEAMEYYFKYNDGNFFDFVNKLDHYYEASQTSKEDSKNREDLESATKQQLKKIREAHIGE